MKRYWSLILVGCIVVPSAISQAAEADGMRGAKISEREEPKATIIMGANETIGGIGQPGWPLIVSAVMDPKEAAFPDGLTVKVRDEKGVEVPIAFESVPPGED